MNNQQLIYQLTKELYELKYKLYKIELGVTNVHEELQGNCTPAGWSYIKHQVIGICNRISLPDDFSDLDKRGN
jgi:hypothetical protein